MDKPDIQVLVCYLPTHSHPGQTDNAWCYGWVVKRQTVSSVINQIGICGGILGVSGTLFACMFRSTRDLIWQKILSCTLVALSVSLIVVMIIVSCVIHISFSIYLSLNKPTATTKTRLLQNFNRFK